MKIFLTIFLSVSFVFISIFGINCVYGYFFPIKFESEIETACELYDVDKTIVFAIINTESHFNKNAVSQKGAVGLMQVLPSTALSLKNEVDENMSVIDEKEMEDALKNPSVNIKFGTFYFSKLLKKFDNVIDTALCAYNAGPTVVNGWLQNSSYSVDEKNLVKVPYRETENYLQKFHKNFNYYNTKIK